MNAADHEALTAISRLYSAPAHRLPPAVLVQHDLLTGRAHVNIPPIMRSGLEQLGYDPNAYGRTYEDNLRRQGLWPADRPPLYVLPRIKPWSRRGWRVVIGHRKR
ncbi:MAG TPA: hypothetical protein VMT30_09495 [Candidatus Saccharimonadia bacterium]|nr:hypothetical protein [Candidatus Saccharimonadia bacterium]